MRRIPAAGFPLTRRNRARELPRLCRHPSHQAHRRALAKARTKRVERRNAWRGILPDPTQEL